MTFNYFNENTDLLNEFKELLRNMPTYVTDWSSPDITPDIYRLYGRKTPANGTKRNLIQTIRSNIPPEQLREKLAVDRERIRFSHNEWAITSEETSKKLNKYVKESSTVLVYKGSECEFTNNIDGKYSQGQMALLYDLLDQEVLERNGRIKILAAPTGLHDIDYNRFISKEEYIEMGFYEVNIGLAPTRMQVINRY